MVKTKGAGNEKLVCCTINSSWCLFEIMYNICELYKIRCTRYYFRLEYTVQSASGPGCIQAGEVLVLALVRPHDSCALNVVRFTSKNACIQMFRLKRLRNEVPCKRT